MLDLKHRTNKKPLESKRLYNGGPGLAAQDRQRELQRSKSHRRFRLRLNRFRRLYLRQAHEFMGTDVSWLGPDGLSLFRQQRCCSLGRRSRWLGSSLVRAKLKKSGARLHELRFC